MVAIRDRVLDLRRVRAGDLLPNPKNWRRHPKPQADALRGALAEIGYADALIARETTAGLMLIDGHLRAETTPDMEVPVLVVDLDEAEADKLLLTLDPLAAMAEAGTEALASLLADVQTSSGALQAMLDGLAHEAGLNGAKAGLTDPDAVPEVPEPVSKTGDLWLCGDHRLLCGDCTKAKDVRRAMDGAVPQLMVTDPPYGVEYEGGEANAKKRAKLAGDDGDGVVAPALRLASEHIPQGAWYVWHADRRAIGTYEAIAEGGYEVRSLIVWNKLKAHYGSPAAHYCQRHEPCLYAVRGSAGWVGPSNEVSVWDIEQPNRNEHHSTQKPLECMSRPIRNHESEFVYDPFLGSGTTMVACENLGRKCRGIEIHPPYCAVTLERMATAFPGIEIHKCPTP